MPERKPFQMPDGKIYLFPHDVTDDELLTFANQVDPWMPSLPSHEPAIDTEVEPAAPDSMIGEESGERTPPTLEPSHEKMLTQAEALKAVELAAMTPATAPGALHAVGRGEGTDLDRAISGVSPAPGPYMGDFFRDPGPYFEDIGAEIGKETKRAVTHPLEFAGDVGTVLTAPSGGFNIAFGDQPPSMGPDDPLMARALERGTAQVGGLATAFMGILADAMERGPFVDDQGQPTYPLGEPGEDAISKRLFEKSAEVAEYVSEIDTGARTIWDVDDPSKTSEFIVNVFGDQGPIIAGLVGATMLGGPGALVPAAAGLETGAIAQDMMMKQGEVDPDAAAIGGLVAGALEAVPIMLWMRRTGFGEGATRWVASRAMSMAAQAPEEAGTEYVQTLVEALAVEWLSKNRDQITAQDWETAMRIIEETQPEAVGASVTGAVAGGGFGALGGAQMTEAQLKRQRERLFKRVMRAKAKAEQVAAEGTREKTFEAVGAAGEETGLPPLGAPGEVVGGPRVPMFEEMAAIEQGPRAETPSEPTEAAPEPEEEEAAPTEEAPEVAEEGELPEGEWEFSDTEQGFLVEGQQSTIYEVKKGGEVVGTAQMRVNPAGDVVIVDHVETEAYGYPRGAINMFELRAEAAKLFPEATYIAGLRELEDGTSKWVSIRLHPKKKAELPPTTEEEGPLDLDLDVDWTVDEMVEYMTDLLDNWELTTEEAEVLDDFLDPDKPDSWKPPDLTTENMAKVDAIQARIDEMVGKKPEEGAGPEEEKAPFVVGQALYRTRDSMRADVISVRKSDAGHWLIRLEFEDGHKHTFRSTEIEKKFNVGPGAPGTVQGEPPTTPPTRDLKPTVAALFQSNPKKGFTLAEVYRSYKETTGEAAPEGMIESVIEDLLSEGTIEGKREETGGFEYVEYKLRTVPVKPKKKKGAAKEEVREAVADVVTSSGLDFTYGTIFDRVKVRVGKAATDSQVTKAIDELVAEGVIEESTEAYRDQKEPIYRRPAEPELPEKETKTADHVIEASPDEAKAVATAKGAPQGDGFTKAQRTWIVDSLEDVGEIPEPQEPGPTHYAIEMRVPDDGTFHFASGESAIEFRKLVRKPRTVGVSPIKRPSRLGPAPLPYSTSDGWVDTIPTEKEGVITSGHQLIIEMDPAAPAKVKNRIKKVEEKDAKKVSKDGVERVMEGAEKAADVIRVRSLAWPNPYATGNPGMFLVILETDKGTRVTDMMVSFDKLRFMQDATGFDEMRTQLTNPPKQRTLGLFKDGKLVGILMPSLPSGFHYHATEPNPAAEEAEGETPPKEGTDANRDRFRAFHQDNGHQGSGGGALATPGPPMLHVFKVGLPELVRIAKMLGKGKYPRIKRIIMRDPGVLGAFFRGRRPKIELKAAIFQEPEQAAATLAHEVGHWVDFIPLKSMAHGNILGRLIGLGVYLKHTASKNPAIQEAGRGHITEEDRKRIKAQAKAESREEYWEEIEEVLREELGVTVDDVLNIWRQYEPDAPPDLIAFIKGLSSAQKVAIVKQAMQGLVAPELERFKRTIETPTGKKRRVKKVRYKDVDKLFRELLYAEMKARDIVHKEDIWNEMWELSITWRPLPASPSPQHLRYRQKHTEVYADAVSAFLNDPALFQRIAPDSFQMFMNYLHNKPEFYDTWLMLQQFAGNPELVRQARADEYESMIARGEVARARDLKERLGIGVGFKRHRATIAEALASGFIDRNAAWYKLRRLRRKNPDDGQWHEENDVIFNIEELAYSNSKYAYYLDRWQAEVMKPLEDILTHKELGVILGLRRAGRQRKRGGRAELANPLGIGSKDARETLAQYLKDRDFTRTNLRVIVEALQRWQAIREEILAEIAESRMFKPSLVKHMRDSLGAYATFKVRQYIESPDERVGAALGYVHHQIGTFNEIGNPVIETILKDLALARAAHRTTTIKMMIDQLVEADPDALMPARRKKVRGVETSFPPAPRGMELVTYLENGKVRGVFMDKQYAKALNQREVGAAYQTYRWLTGFVRAVMVTHNPFWAIWNTERDFRAMVKQIQGDDPVTAILKGLYWTLTSAPEAFKDVARSSATLRRFGWMYEKITGKPFDFEAKTVRAMLKDQALIQTGMRFYVAADITEEEASAALFQTYGLADADHQTVVRSVFGYVASILSGPGQFSERLIKIAGYRWLKANQEKLALSDKEIAHMVRARVGTPDIMRRGDWHNATNSFFLFSNVAKEGYRAGWESLGEDPIRYGAKTLTYDIAPTIVKWMAASGFLGAAIKGLFDRIPEYHKRTYTIIPIGMTSSGKAVYFILPHDHLGQLVISSIWGALDQDEKLRQDVAYEAAQNLPWSHGSLHPYIESTIQWFQYAKGVNPTDWYRGRKVIPERVWEAGDIWARRRYMLGNQFDNLGLRVLTDLTRLEDENGDVDPQGVADWMEKGTGWPVAGSVLRRFIRVSDRGITEEGFKRFREADEGPAKGRLDRDNALKEMLEVNYNIDGWDAIVELERRGIDPAYKYEKEKELAKKLDVRLDTMRLRYYGTEYDRLRSYANTEDRKAIVDELERETEGKEAE